MSIYKDKYEEALTNTKATGPFLSGCRDFLRYHGYLTEKQMNALHNATARITTVHRSKHTRNHDLGTCPDGLCENDWMGFGTSAYWGKD